MSDIFLKDQEFNQDELMALLLNYQFEDVFYESDDYGHVQVGMSLAPNCYSFNGLIEQVEQMQLWPKLKQRLPEQSEQWLNEFSVRLVQHPGKFQLTCLTSMTDCYSSETGRLFHLLSASTWPWEYGRRQDITEVESQLLQTKLQLSTDDLHLAMLEDTLQKLETFKVKLL